MDDNTGGGYAYTAITLYICILLYMHTEYVYTDHHGGYQPPCYAMYQTTPQEKPQEKKRGQFM